MAKESSKEKKAAKKLRKLEKKARKEKRKLSKLTKDGLEDEDSEAKRLRKKEKKRQKKMRKENETIPSATVSQSEEGTKEGTLEEPHESPIGQKSGETQQTSQTEQDLSTPFRKKRLKMLVSLLPHSLKSIHQNIQKRISTLLLKYTDGVGGVLLTFSNLQYSEYQQGGIGKIWSESPYIHYTVEVDALVFEPCAGMKLTGVVNECFPSHVGMLVRSFFNAMIPSQMLLDGYEFNSSSQKWQRTGNGEADDGMAEIGIDDEVAFEVEKIHECAGIISIEGKLAK